MMPRLLAALAVTLLLPGWALAIPRPATPRLHPGATSPLPSYVQKMAPALVGLRVRAAEGSPSAARLGSQRFVTGVIFDARGYAVTVSYGVLDAVRIEARRRDQTTVAARLVAIDFATGLAVVKLEGSGPWPTAVLGQSADVTMGTPTATVGVDEDDDLVQVPGTVHAIRRFAAFWEYMLDRAFLVAPASPAWGGSALVNQRGELIGITSLRLGEAPHVNLAIPLETFLPVKDELISAGRVVSRPPRPWLGLQTAGGPAGVIVQGFSAQGPAAGAGFRKGDRIVRVNGVEVRSQEEFYEELWRQRAGDLIEVAVRRDGGVHIIPVRGIDRHRLYRPPPAE